MGEIHRPLSPENPTQSERGYTHGSSFPHLLQQLDYECPFAGLKGHEVLAQGGAGEGEALAEGTLDLDDAQAEKMHVVADPSRSLDVLGVCGCVGECG